MGMNGRGKLAAGGFVGGVIVGLLVWNGQLHRHRRDLFSDRALRRWIALSYLSSQPSIENARLLSDYVSWEPRPRLRRRGIAVLRRMERVLD